MPVKSEIAAGKAKRERTSFTKHIKRITFLSAVLTLSYFFSDFNDRGQKYLVTPYIYLSEKVSDIFALFLLSPYILFVEAIKFIPQKILYMVFFDRFCEDIFYLMSGERQVFCFEERIGDMYLLLPYFLVCVMVVVVTYSIIQMFFRKFGRRK